MRAVSTWPNPYQGPWKSRQKSRSRRIGWHSIDSLPGAEASGWKWALPTRVVSYPHARRRSPTVGTSSGSFTPIVQQWCHAGKSPVIIVAREGEQTGLAQ
jgi:hypothetical protein